MLLAMTWLHAIPPMAKPTEVAGWYSGVFDENQLAQLEAWAAEAKDEGDTGLAPGSGFTEKEPSKAIRRSKVSWLTMDSGAGWVFDVLSQVVAEANADYFRFDLAGFCEPLQLAKYVDTDLGHYDWHQDTGGRLPRKLSITVQLTDDDKYEGGDLQIFKAANQVLMAPRARGTIIVFPSYQLHRVAPVTKGTRHSLVGWVAGPAYR